MTLGVVAPSEPVGSRYFKKKKKTMHAIYDFLGILYKALLLEFCSIGGTKFRNVMSHTEVILAM